MIKHRESEEPANERIWCDITRTLGLDVVRFPGDPAFRKNEIGVAGTTISSLSLSSHAGTHLDAPRHLFPDGKTLDLYPAARFVLQAYVLHSRSDSQIAQAEIENVDLRGVQAMLFRTRNESISRAVVAPKWVSPSVDAAQFLIRLGITLVGIDYISIDSWEDAHLPVHRTLLGADVLVLEDVNLAGVQEGRHTLVCLPLKIQGADGAPCRAIIAR